VLLHGSNMENERELDDKYVIDYGVVAYAADKNNTLYGCSDCTRLRVDNNWVSVMHPGINPDMTPEEKINYRVKFQRKLGIGFDSNPKVYGLSHGYCPDCVEKAFGEIEEFLASNK